MRTKARRRSAQRNHKTENEELMQGVVKSYDPMTKDGVVLSERDLTEIDLAEDALRVRSSGCSDRDSE
ncbi:MAG: hypothetical protein R2710_05045 [Acidimicrobiales bacterium]